MPRSAQSKEHTILEWFGTAPIQVATVILGLAQAAVKARTPVPVKPATRRPRRRPLPGAAVPGAARVSRGTTMPSGQAKPLLKTKPGDVPTMVED